MVFSVVLSRWRRLGLRLRIMTYVTIGLVVLFGGLAFFGMRAVQEASNQILYERTRFAQTLAQALETDLKHLGTHIEVALESLSPPQEPELAADRLFRLLSHRQTSEFFTVASLRFVDKQGRVLAAAPADLRQAPLPPLELIDRALEQDRPQVVRSRAAPEGAIPFASLMVPVSAPWTGGQPLAAVVDTVGVSESIHGVELGGQAYWVEVLGEDGTSLIFTGRPELVGKKSFHYPLIQNAGKAALPRGEIHRAPRGDPMREHLVAIAPLPSAPFYLVVEQPADLALAVPRRLQQQALIVGTVGIFLALVVAWYTTRAVVGPVGKLRVAARGIAAGDLDRPVQVVAQD